MYNDPNAQPPYGQPPYNQPSGPYQQSPYNNPPPYSQQPYGAPPYPQTGYGQPQQPQPLPQKSSNRGLVVGCSIAAVVVLLLLGVCGGVVYFVYLRGSQAVSNTFQQIEATATADQATTIADEPSPQQQAESYYQAVEAQDYATAYTYMASNITDTDGSHLTESKFNAEAQALDQSEGEVTNFTVTVDPSDSTKITVQVTRSGGKTYTVHMTFTQSASAWSIRSFSNI